MVTIIDGAPSEAEVPSIEVYSYPSPLDPSVTISTVTAYDSDGKAGVTHSIVERQKMSFEDAIEEAKKFAGKVGLSKIYARKDA